LISLLNESRGTRQVNGTFAPGLAGGQAQKPVVARGHARGRGWAQAEPQKGAAADRTAGRLAVEQPGAELAPGGIGGLAGRLVDADRRHGAVGARVEVHAGGRKFARGVRSPGSYLSCWEAPLHFGLGSARDVERIVVHWPEGGSETFRGGPSGRLVTLTKGQGER